MFGFSKAKSKTVNVLSHWYTPVPKFTTSTQEFYTKVEKELKTQDVPGLEISRVEFSESGIFSAKREYLRLTRERLAFDICAAPFGINYFFSCRFAELPRQLPWGSVGVALFVIASFLIILQAILGAKAGFIISAVFFGAIIFFFRNAVSLGFAALDATLRKKPLLVPIYEYLTKESYYREDTRLMYLTVVEGVVKKLVEQEAAAKGIKLLDEYEYAPILGDLYRPKKKSLEQKAVVSQ